MNEFAENWIIKISDYLWKEGLIKKNIGPGYFLSHRKDLRQLTEVLFYKSGYCKSTGIISLSGSRDHAVPNLYSHSLLPACPSLAACP